MVLKRKNEGLLKIGSSTEDPLDFSIAGKILSSLLLTSIAVNPVGLVD